MKKQTGIWIDGSKAIVVTLADGQETIKEIPSDIENRIHHKSEGDKGTFMGNRHINHEKKFEERKKHQIDHFVSKVVDQIKQDDALYVFGPGELKLVLKKRIEKEGHLISKLHPVETADSMTLNQVVAQVKEFYSTKNKHHAH
jgi:hypothetical protein